MNFIISFVYYGCRNGAKCNKNISLFDKKHFYSMKYISIDKTYFYLKNIISFVNKKFSLKNPGLFNFQIEIFVCDKITW